MNVEKPHEREFNIISHNGNGQIKPKWNTNVSIGMDKIKRLLFKMLSIKKSKQYSYLSLVGM